tara:strand:+ start:1931 stop:3184 length:1254 start_codon:yes stop_codon:yes gene_type:complete
MALPILSPSSQTSAITLPSGSSPSDVAAAELPFGIYQSDAYFLSGAADQVAYTYKKLGGDVLDVEITKEQVYAAYEESVLEYSYIVNIHQAKNVLGDAFGDTTGTFNHDGGIISGPENVSLKFPKITFSYAKRVSERVATEANIGGNVRIHSASFTRVVDQQDYDLQHIVSSSAATDTDVPYYGLVGNKKIYVQRVYHKTPHAMWRFYGYYGGLNTVGDLASYGQFADDSTFEVIPPFQNKLQAMAFEDAIYTRNSHYSYEIKNNKLRIFPTPVGNSPTQFWIEFYIREDSWEESSGPKSGVDGINNMNTLPFSNLPYQNINSIGKQWIRRFALSLSKEMLGQIRSKFGAIPIPGESVTLNGEALLGQAKEEQDKLREELKTVLDELTYSKMAENDASLMDSTNKILSKIPSPIIVG